jgi:hypothetical protein
LLDVEDASLVGCHAPAALEDAGAGVDAGTLYFEGDHGLEGVVCCEFVEEVEVLGEADF